MVVGGNEQGTWVVAEVVRDRTRLAEPLCGWTGEERIGKESTASLSRVSVGWTEPAAAFGTAGVSPLPVTHGEDGL
jgi:hypothetical protein